MSDEPSIEVQIEDEKQEEPDERPPGHAAQAGVDTAARTEALGGDAEPAVTEAPANPFTAVPLPEGAASPFSEPLEARRRLSISEAPPSDGAGRLSFPSMLPPEPSQPLGTQLVVVGAGRGGVGKSLVASNLAVYLAQLGKAVVLVDADPTGTNLHARFGIAAGTRAFGRAAEKHGSRDDRPGDERKDDAGPSLERIPTEVPGLSLVPAAHEAAEPPFSGRASRHTRWLEELKQLRADYVVVDAGPGHGHFALDALLAADVAIAVTVPEPPAIETTYRALRAAYRRRLRRALPRDDARHATLDRVYRATGPLPSPLALVRAVAESDPSLAAIAWAEAQSMRHHLVVNQTRVRTDLDLGQWMSILVERHYGLRLEELGHVEHDDTVWLAVRKNRPLLVDSPTSKSARNLERIARRVLALSLSHVRERPSLPSSWEVAARAEPTLYATLGVTRSSNDEEVRRAYKRQREIYATSGLATVSLLNDDELLTAQARLDEAYDTLLDPVRRRAYDLSTFPEMDTAGFSGRPSRVFDAEQTMMQRELAREIGPDTEFTGALLRKVREAKGIEIPEIAARTKISWAHLQAIEEDSYFALPALVYARGFVTELAKYLGLDPSHVQRTYLRRMRAALARGGSRGTFD